MRADRLSVRTVVDKPEIRQDVTRELVVHIQGPKQLSRALWFIKMIPVDL